MKCKRPWYEPSIHAKRLGEVTVKLFKKISDVLDNARIAYTFSAFEDKARAQHLASAARRFSTGALEVDAYKRMEATHTIADQRFVQPEIGLNIKVVRIQAALHTSATRLAIFERDYPRELHALHAKRRELSDECRSINSAKSEAYDDLQSAVDDLDDWHSRSSGTFFGNGGKALPKRAVFGQSLGDRDSLKDDRDVAGSEIAACKKALASKRLEIKQVEDRIGQVKADRQQMRDLRAHGCSARTFHEAVVDCTRELDQTKRDIAQLQVNRVEFITAAKYRTGTISIEAEIAKVRARRDAFIHSFDTAQASAQRKASHRAEWLEKKGQKKS